MVSSQTKSKRRGGGGGGGSRRAPSKAVAKKIIKNDTIIDNFVENPKESPFHMGRVTRVQGNGNFLVRDLEMGYDIRATLSGKVAGRGMPGPESSLAVFGGSYVLLSGGRNISMKGGRIEAVFNSFQAEEARHKLGIRSDGSFKRSSQLLSEEKKTRAAQMQELAFNAGLGRRHGLSEVVEDEGPVFRISASRSGSRSRSRTPSPNLGAKPKSKRVRKVPTGFSAIGSWLGFF